MSTNDQLLSAGHIVLTAGNNPYYMNVAINISSKLINEGNEVLIVDMSEVTNGPVNLYNEGCLRVLGLPSVADHLKSEVKRNNITFLSLDHIHTAHSSDSAIAIVPNLDSPVISLARDETPSRASFKRILRKMNEEYVNAHQSFSHLLSNFNELQAVHIPNGRFPWQRAVIDLANSKGVAVNYYERGLLSDRYFYKPFPTQDRISIERDFRTWLDSANQELEIKFAQEWLNLRMIGKQDKNDFSWNWQNSPLSGDFNVIQESKIKKATIFTSSEDEFVALGQDWNLHKWKNQWQAIEKLVCYLIENNFEVTIRIHPNLANKSHKSYVRTLRNASRISKINSRITIHRHDSNVNSYSLLQQSSLVFVWDSTIGLEASALGKNVFCLAPTLYSSAINAHELFSEEGFTTESVPNLQSKIDALLFLSYLTHRDQILDASLSDNWNYSELEGLRGNLAMWLSADVNILKSVQRGFEVMRHRSLIASIQLISRKLEFRQKHTK